MNINFPEAISAVLKHEGGFVNHPKDPGGATNKGITLATYRRYIDRNGTVADLKAIQEWQVDHVYRTQYWDAVRGSDLPSGVDYAVFDFAVNSGPSRAIRYLQAVVGAEQDGIIGPKTLAAVRSQPATAIIDALCDRRMGFLRGLKTWPTFGRGWTNRVAGVRSLAKTMAGRVSQSPVQPHSPKPNVSGSATAKSSHSVNSGGLASILAAFFNRLFGKASK